MKKLKNNNKKEKKKKREPGVEDEPRHT